MKKLLIICAVILFCSSSIAQDKLYLTFEFMKVENHQENSYWDTENFWEKIHQQRVLNKDIVGWDLWVLKPGGEDQGFQFLTVTLYDNYVKMLSGGGDIMKAAKTAYPEMQEDELINKIDESTKSRNLSVRLFLEQLKVTNGDFKMKPGIIASIDFMKAKVGEYEAYEKAEKEIFYPMHQDMVDTGSKGRWTLVKVLSPSGSDVYTSHLTVNMYTGFDQFVQQGERTGEPISDSETQKIQEGFKTRDMKWVYLAELAKMVR